MVARGVLEALKTADTENYKNRWLSGLRPRRVTTMVIVARCWVGGQKLTNEFPPWYSTTLPPPHSPPPPHLLLLRLTPPWTREGSGVIRVPIVGFNKTIRKRYSYWLFADVWTSIDANCLETTFQLRSDWPLSSLLFLTAKNTVHI